MIQQSDENGFRASWLPFDDKHQPSKAQRDAIQFLLYALYDGSRPLGFKWFTYWTWMEDNVSGRVLDTLEAKGWIFRIFHGDYMYYALSHEAAKWAENHFSVPATLDMEQLYDWVRQNLGSKIVSRQETTKKPHTSSGIKRCTDYVRSESYSNESAAKAKRDIDQQVSCGKLSRRSAAAVKAHISRRTV